MKNSILLGVGLLLLLMLIFSGCLNVQKSDDKMVISEEKKTENKETKAQNIVNESENKSLNKSKEKELYNEILCNFMEKEQLFEMGAAIYSDEGNIEISGESEDYRIKILLPWKDKGKYSYDEEKRPKITLYEKKLIDRKVYVLNYNEKYNLEINEINEEHLKGDVKGELYVLGNRENKYPIECSFNVNFNEEYFDEELKINNNSNSSKNESQ